ncbi:MAG: hypothetical protein HKN08_10860, partial [Gammaproteobacteria bacterium]|nr:hypothetical protein [Gammaproteobacteria bacterium]
MCQGRHHPITTTNSDKLGIAYCLLGMLLLFLGCARQDDAPFVSHSSESTQASNAETPTQEDTPDVIQPEIEIPKTNQLP